MERDIEMSSRERRRPPVRPAPAALAVALLAAAGLASCAGGGSGGHGLKDTRLFVVDDQNNWIEEWDPSNGKRLNFFPAPTPTISANGVALAFDAKSEVLYFLDPSEPTAIWRILPAASSPGGASALTLPEPAFFTYDAFGWDGRHLLALDSDLDFIDALNPGTGAIEESTDYPVDLQSGLDANRRKGIWVSGVDGVTGNMVIYHLDGNGVVKGQIDLEPGFDPRGIAVAKNFVFVADAATRKIRIFRIGKKKKQFILKPVKELDFPPNATVSALAAGWQ